MDIPERRKPEKVRNEAIMYLFSGTVFAVFGVLALLGLHLPEAAGLALLALITVFLGIALLIMAILDFRKLHNMEFVTANATILNCYDETHKDAYGGTYHTYKVTLQFDAMEKQVLLMAKVNSDVYAKLSLGAQTTVRYANSDPRIALLEGEDKK